MRRPARLAATLLLAPPAALLAPRAALAQWSGSVGIDSQALFRGYRLSDGQPSPRAALSYDAGSGAYAGLSVARTVFTAGQGSAQWLGYAGFARRFDARPALAWEAGVTASHFTLDPDYDYAEAYAGLLGDGWNLRLHAAPDYFGQGATTWYAEANSGGALPFGMHGLQWLAHGGLTHAGSTSALGGDMRRWRADWRFGVAGTWQRLTLQLAWVGAQPARTGDAPPWGDAGYGAGAGTQLRPVTGTWQASATFAF